MAGNEIQYQHDQTGETLYCVVENLAGELWNTNGTPAFETRTVANWTTNHYYDIALPETPASSYRYEGDMPAVGAGWFWLRFFVKGGGTSAISDFCLTSILYYWDETTLYPGSSGLNAEVLEVDVTHLMGTILTEGASGRLKAGFTKVFDVASPVFTAASVNQAADNNVLLANGTYGLAHLVRSTTPANALDVSSSGEAGLDFANIKDATGAHTLTNITVPAVTATAGIGAGGIVAASFAADSIAAASIKTGAFTADAFAADAIVAATFATNSIAADALAADAATEIAEAVADADRGNILETTTIKALVEESQTSFTLNAGSIDNDAYINCQIVIENASMAARKAIGYISAYTGATKTVTLQADPAIFPMAATDKVTILAMPYVSGGTGANTVTITVDDGTDALADVEGWITTDAAGTNTIKSGTTDDNGIMEGKPHLTDGTYYLWLKVSGYDMTNSPETLTVAGTADAYAETFSMTAATGGGGTSTDYMEYTVDDVLADIADKLGGSPTDATQMRHLVAGYRTVLNGMDMRERPPRKHFWTFLEPAVTLNFWTTATGTMSVSTTTITTITDSTNSPFYDSMVGATLVADTSETEYTITSVTSTSVVVVSSSAAADDGDTFTITANGYYSTPAGYRGMKQRPVFANSSSGTRHKLTEASPEHIRELWRRDSSLGYTRMYAIEPLEFVAATGQRYRILTYPIPTEDMTATARIRLRVPSPESGQRFIGGDIVSIPVRDAALADVELSQGDTSGVWCAKADKSLMAAIDADRTETASHSVERMESGR